MSPSPKQKRVAGAGSYAKPDPHGRSLVVGVMQKSPHPAEKLGINGYAQIFFINWGPKALLGSGLASQQKGLIE